jgi:uncharacterized protein (DUF1697 family)
MSETFVALLRGVNVGGKNKLPMKDLAAICTDAECRDVATFIQSGNVIFDASSKLATQLPGRIAGRIDERFGYRTPVILRTTEQLAAVVANNPFLQRGVAEALLHVLFLPAPAAPDRVDALDPNRSVPDAFAAFGSEVYLMLPNGAGRTKLTNDYFDARLATMSTGRNWRTVTKLLELMRARSGR